MNAEFWNVSAKSPNPLPFTAADVCDHLLADWMPSMPASLGASFIGWPPLLLEPVNLPTATFLSLREQAGGAERQWKGFVSWMLGIAGTRQFLRADGYRWVAPVSAFLESAVKPVALHGWPSALPKSRLATRRRLGSGSRLMPDYLALRPTTRAGSGGHVFAVVESKGIHGCLTNRRCPRHWYRQARNIEVLVDNKTIHIPRHLVVATRVNPNAAKAATRRIQIRAWNSSDDAPPRPIGEAGVAELVSGHLFGMLRAVRLFEHARAVALGMEWRASDSTDRRSELTTLRKTVFDAVVTEAQERTVTIGVSESAALLGPVMTFDTEGARLHVRVDPALLALAQSLGAAENVRSAADAVEAADRRLDKTESILRSERPDSVRRGVYTGLDVRVQTRFGEDNEQG